MTYVPPVDHTDTQHDGTEHLAIKNTWLRRIVTRLALRTSAKFFKRDGLCVPISKTKIVKSGTWVHLTEAATMQFVAEKTSIPVPKVHCAFVHKNRAYIVMERISGEVLPRVWGKLSQASRQRVLAQLKTMLCELRALQPPPGTGVHSCVGGSLYDSRIAHARPRFGPFATIQEFHLWLRGSLRPSEHPEKEDDEDWLEIKDMAAKQDGPWPPPVFTHGDLHPFNILLRGDTVVGIIDWEFSGWYPHYWEYTAAWYGNILRLEWQRQLDTFLDPYPDELKMEITRQKWWGEY